MGALKTVIIFGIVILSNTEISLVAHTNNGTYVQQRKEFFGKSYKKLGLKAAETKIVSDKELFEIVQKRLPKKFKKDAEVLAKTIRIESTNYGLDPLFVVAMIENESSFNPLARGPVGELGLMQLRPETAEWISDIANIEYKGILSLVDLKQNVKLGCAYISYLRSKFGKQGQLYVSAYNMGASKVRAAQHENRTPASYHGRVEKRYLKLIAKAPVSKVKMAQN